MIRTQEITERDSGDGGTEYTVRRTEYDDLPTADHSAQDERDAMNADAYAAQLEAMIHEREPMIAVFANIGAMLLNGIDTVAGKRFGTWAQELYDDTRARIEREAGVD